MMVSPMHRLVKSVRMHSEMVSPQCGHLAKSGLILVLLVGLAVEDSGQHDHVQEEAMMDPGAFLLAEQAV